ncbi:hypothetical protein DEU56DRAFT_976202 [Suillus clintonianus]|uniref:uncharacterized protein n=1 Tax=Suillus clintonianus TaxID=1904413 RepID=UPI001B876E5D|nr:uncharacterized protein DEU56DRAFT_976202 [Suillus clintonianus]KAG2155631.1 hypothetical protein DEU56DRAFT_976202 [Suillus clintonianus]
MNSDSTVMHDALHYYQQPGPYSLHQTVGSNNCSVHTEYPDDYSVKEVTLYAAGYDIHSDHHVLLQWLNSTKDDAPVAQIVQLTGNYNYYAPIVTCTDTTIRNQVIPVGAFSRIQRDQILHLANQVKFQNSSTTNNCRVWLRELLMAMVDEELITQAKFDEIIEVDPLQMRRPEQ